MVRPTGFEPTTSRVGVWHSIQLSYGRISTICIIAKNKRKVNTGFHFADSML